MARNHAFIFAALMAAAPQIVFAGDASGAVTIGIGRSSLSDGGGDLTSNTLDFSGKAKLGSSVEARLGFSYAKIRPDDVDGDLSAASFSLGASYLFSGGFDAGLYYEHGKLSLGSGLTGDVSADSYGLTLGLKRQNFTVNGFYGKTDTDPSLGSGIDVRDFGVGFGALLSDQAMISGNFIRTTLDDGSESANLDYIDLAATYQFNDAVSSFGGLSHTRVKDLDLNVTTFGLGVGYNLGARTGFGGTLAAELAHSKLDLMGSSGNMNSFRISFTVPLGGTGAKLPLNSVAGAVQNPRHDALSSTILSAF